MAMINPDTGRYVLPYNIHYFSERYQHPVDMDFGYESDGATGATDLWSEGFWVHDYLCDHGTFSDGTPCTNWQASTVLGDILKAEGRWFRARSWRIATFLFGGGKARKNGMCKLKSEK